MNVLIVNNMTPFVRGGAEELAHHLSMRLNATQGVRAEILRVPFSWEPEERLADEIFLNRTLRLENVDRVIALKFPAYLIPHHAKTFWLLHHYRQVHDSRERVESNLRETSAGARIRELIRRADGEAFSSCRKIFTNSEVTRARLKHNNGFDAEVLMPPLNNPELFTNRGDAGYIFAGGRINSNQRQQLLVESIGLAQSAAKLIVAGPPDTPEDAERLLSAVKRLNLEDRVTLDFDFHPVAKIADYVGHSRACACLPVDEDLVDCFTMEAMSASKPVLTLRDSAEILELVLDGETGYVVPPDAKSIALAIDSLFSQPERSAQMGRTARQLWDSLNISWPITVEKLLS